VASILVALALLLASCAKAPPALSPEAVIAFHATRVVKALDVMRDAAIAGNEMAPPAFSIDSTRTVVLWHKTAVQVIQAVPSGWKATVRASIFALTCDVRAFGVSPAPPCTPQISPAEVLRLSPYIGLVLVVIAEVL